MRLSPGDKIGRFTVLELLGEGGMGTVYAVRDPQRPEEALALKVLRADMAASAELRERFAREAKTVGGLYKRGIVWALEADAHGSPAWLLMERVAGLPLPDGRRALSLAELRKAYGDALPEREVARLLDICLDGLYAAHAQGVVHRDLKPENILLDPGGESDSTKALEKAEPKIADFGLVALRETKGDLDHTDTMQPPLTMQGQRAGREGALLGTWDFMAPEQKKGQPADKRSDTYAMTLIAFWLLTGQNLGVNKAGELRPALSPSWEAFLERGYAPDPSARYQDAAEMRQALQPVIRVLAGAETGTREISAAEDKRQEGKRHLAETRRKSGIWYWVLGVGAALAGGCWVYAHHTRGQHVQVTPPTVARSQPAAMPAPQPELQAGHRWTNSLGMVFVPVAGTAVQFSIWDTRVQDYQVFVAATKRAWEKPSFAQGPTHPAVNVSWDDAKAFCAWLTEKEQRAGALNPTQTYRLPSDLEWSTAVGLEKEAGSTPKERDGKVADVYPWGTAWPPPRGAGNYARSMNVDDFDYTSPVGSFAANKFGLYDMGGNVWQRCEDSYNGRSGASVMRGGSWHVVGTLLLSSCRGRGNGHDSLGNYGFRCVLTGGGVSAPQTQSDAVSTAAGTPPSMPVVPAPRPAETAMGQKPPVAGDWVMTLDEEFNGTMLDTNRWNIYAQNCWDKRSHFSKDNVILGDGLAKLRFEKKTGDHNDDSSNASTAYATGYLDTYGKWTQRYGYFEARMKLPAAPGLWPAFWMMPDRGVALGPQWKRTDTGNGGMEFDIMEHLTRWGPHRYNIAMHWDGYGKEQQNKGFTCNDAQADQDGFITAGLLWLPGSAVCYCNGREVARWENARVSNVASYLMFTHVSGGWDNNALDDAQLPADFTIDYVRCWQRRDLVSEADDAKSGTPQ